MWCCLHFRHACPTVRVCGHANARVKEKFQRTFTRICVGVWNHERACKEGGERRWTGNVIFIGLWCVSVSTMEDTQWVR